jgi:TolB-like protein/predicted Ser/Thr protein kinase
MLDRVQSGALSPGTCIGRYEVESFLGAGGMGEVYVARDTTLGRRIALKVLPSGCERGRIERFIREAQASSALNHPAIVSVHDAGSADGIQFLAMELIDGEPLSSWMRSHRNARRATELMAQVADGLAGAHGAGIVHRDLKPANIMISRDGHAKIVDFGVAKLTERASGPEDTTELKTAEGTRVGTVAYMSPEQIEGHDVDYRSDIFSFGTVLYELLTGNHPFAANSQADTIHNIAHCEPPLDAIPARQRRIVGRCLAKEPGQRYQSMKDVAHDLREPLAESSPGAGRARRLRAWLPIAGALVLLVVLFLIGLRHTPTPAATRQPSMHMEPTTNSGTVASAAISPDGKLVVPIHSLAILPFKPIVAAKRDQVLEVGIADTLIAKIGSIRGVVVRPLSAVRPYDGIDQDPIEAGRSLGVDAVLDGTVITASNQVRVVVRLLRVSDSTQLWHGEFKKDLRDIFSVYEDIATQSANELSSQLSGLEWRQLRKRDTANPEAYRSYIVGRLRQSTPNRKEIYNAITFYEHAIQLDPSMRRRTPLWRSPMRGCRSVATRRRDPLAMHRARWRRKRSRSILRTVMRIWPSRWGRCGSTGTGVDRRKSFGMRSL